MTARGNPKSGWNGFIHYPSRRRMDDAPSIASESAPATPCKVWQDESLPVGVIHWAFLAAALTMRAAPVYHKTLTFQSRLGTGAGRLG
ncbi:MAG: hypothetical protein QME60_06225 [Verrucomicrobiota bacterium]|nr:hypothetical protein [Verrucomicrobiota bacterium]